MRKYGDLQESTWYNADMKTTTLTPEQLNAIPRETLTLLFIQLSENFQLITKQNEALLKQVADLKEQLAIMNQRMFGKRSEKGTQIPGQLSLDLDEYSKAFNEAEALIEGGFAEEPDIQEVVVHKRTPRPKENAMPTWKDFRPRGRTIT